MEMKNKKSEKWAVLNKNLLFFLYIYKNVGDSKKKLL